MFIAKLCQSETVPVRGLGSSSDATKRIAAPMIGGLVRSTILTLVVILAIYYIWQGRRLAHQTPINMEPGGGR